jgi:hypothetical protein
VVRSRRLRHLVDLAPRRLLLVLVAAVIAATASFTASSFASPTPVAAASRPKVVVVVGPTHGSTDKYIQRAKRIASQARSLGASVVELYTPWATWARVKAAARGARVLVYLGHGNGSPSPYGPLNKASMNGLGLNPSAGAHKYSPVKYYGEAYVRYLDLAPGAVVLLNHLCYASGNAEPGMAQPGWTVARQRVDNFAAGFIAAGAGAVLADGHTNLSYELRVVLKTHGNLIAAWRADPDNHGHERKFSSVRSPGYITLLDPEGRSSSFYRSLVTRRGFSTRSWALPRAKTQPRLQGYASTAVRLRSSASTGARVRGTLADASRMVVTSGFVADSGGKLWVKVRTPSTRVGYVAAWLVRFRGTTVVRTSVVLRTAGAMHARALGKVPKGAHVKVTASRADADQRVWFRIRTGTGRVGWIASWLTQP